jgi:hypothetical protein
MFLFIFLGSLLLGWVEGADNILGPFLTSVGAFPTLYHDFQLQSSSNNHKLAPAMSTILLGSDLLQVFKIAKGHYRPF